MFLRVCTEGCRCATLFLSQLILCLSAILFLQACHREPVCDDTGSVRYGNQSADIRLVRYDSVPCGAGICLQKDTVLGSWVPTDRYSGVHLSVELDTLGGTQPHMVYPAGSICSDVTRRCGKFAFGTSDKVIGRSYHYVYSLLHADSLMGRLAIRFRLGADPCRTRFSRLDYYWKDQLLPEYSQQMTPVIEVWVSPARL